MLSKKRTFRSRLSGSFNSLSRLIFRDPDKFRIILKPIAIKIVKIFTASRGFSLKIAGKYNVRFCETFFFSNWENFGTGHNSGFEYVMTRVKKDCVFYDIGAHIGLFTIPVSKLFTSVQVVAFEPSSINSKFLKKHIEINRLINVQQLNYLVGDRSKEVEFYEDLYNVNPMGSTVSSLYDSNAFSKTKKRMICLDDFVEQTGPPPTIIKIDVEGAEFDVLRGAQHILKKYSPILVVSLHPRILKSLKIEPAEVVRFIESFGYTCFEDDGCTPYQFSTNEVICEKSDA